MKKKLYVVPISELILIKENLLVQKTSVSMDASRSEEEPWQGGGDLDGGEWEL